MALYVTRDGVAARHKDIFDFNLNKLKRYIIRSTFSILNLYVRIFARVLTEL